MQGERRGPQGLTRRQVLIGGGVVLGAAPRSASRQPARRSRGGSQTVTFWHLFGGGDGERLTEILADIDAEHADSDVRELILPWGNPYYTKLALAAVGGSPPDVAVVHATRLPSFAPAGLLEELTPELLARARPRGRPLPREAVEERPVGRRASTRSRSTPTRSSSTTTPSCPRRRGCSTARQAARARRRERAARGLRGGQGGDREERARVRDARRDAVADLPDALRRSSAARRSSRRAAAGSAWTTRSRSARSSG